MNVLNLSSIDYGGAGMQAVFYTRYLNSIGHNSKLLVLDSKGETDCIIYKKSLFDRIRHRLAKRQLAKVTTDSNYHFFNKYECVNFISSERLLEQSGFIPDVIFLHWVSDFINAKIVSQLQVITKAKIYWFLMDNAPLTGGCHYPWSCIGFESDCKSCPAILNKKYANLAEKNLAFKRKYLPLTLKIVTGGLDYHRSTRSVLFKDTTIIKQLAPVDENKFKPEDKSIAKKYWDIQSTHKVLFVGASSLTEKRKGMNLLVEAINCLDGNNLTVLVAGNDADLSINPHIQVIRVPFLNECQLIKAYQAADIFLCPSIEDSGPLMINQSLMCGTPVVSFRTGVALDIVINNQTGYIARLCDTFDFATGIRSILALNDSLYRELSNNCREFALINFSTKVYVKAINDLLNID